MSSLDATDAHRRLEDRIRDWRITVERLVETDTSVLAFGRRNHTSIVLKITRRPGEEWYSGDVLAAFDGRGVVRALEHTDGAVLLERLAPGTSLAAIAMNEEDDRATAILADVVKTMSPRPTASRVPGIETLAEGFDGYLAGNDGRIPRPLVEAAHRVYLELCASQSAPRLLHGDLHHYNVLLDAKRGWLAIDPKGLIGECEYEMGAALRNPCERPALFAQPATIERRVNRFCRELQRDAGRILAWAFAQAVLAAIWEPEDGPSLQAGRGWIEFANAIWPMLRGVADA